ncbi:pilus assembly protein TadG-related protein [Jiangella alkaliphila]|uniref:Putative Flp pilus-assembly TadE/G-like n=1 Tax=Jiangella alkaliphila TaxID=419479 RepID=A0A1H2H7Z6_9ACTN|nr:pilus assembly protein TadG-related protein [Jiangella alkaliphila]SDU27688.1 Putative Flp pilus-assembly TadE/G-like [Jiangella alkaliphila]
MHRLRDQTGGFTLIFAIVAIALLAMAGLVYDGRRQLTAQQRADAVAAEAARAAGQEIDGSTLIGSPGLDRARAVAAAREHLAAAGIRGTVTVDGNTIVVRADATEPAAILPLVGITTLEATGEASVEIVTGLTGQPRSSPPDSS